ncbi:DUF6555 family protein [Pseudomonas sp. NFX5]|uniref:DUF6555 family protein n=1 Tax=Pseudomonas sp. NFX5 TaxID=2816961 RepID=UPI003B9F04E2
MHFSISYKLNGQPKEFRIRLDHMDDQIALFWACCDAGIERIPKSFRVKSRPISIHTAARNGLTEVTWS